MTPRGPGTCLKEIIAKWLNVKTGGCGGCERLLKAMNRKGPEWCKQHLREIVPAIERNARKNPDWKARILARIPGIRAPIVAIVFLAIARAEEEIKDAAEKKANP